MATKYYGINDKWTDDDIENVIEIASEDGSVDSVKVNGEEYGGGGGSAMTLLDSTHLTIEVGDTSTTQTLLTTLTISDSTLIDHSTYLVCEVRKDTAEVGYTGSDIFVSYVYNNGNNEPKIVGIMYRYYNDYLTGTPSSTLNGIYIDPILATNGTLTVKIYKKYNSTYTTGWAGTYTLKLYEANLSPMVPPAFNIVQSD